MHFLVCRVLSWRNILFSQWIIVICKFNFYCLGIFADSCATVIESVERFLKKTLWKARVTRHSCILLSMCTCSYLYFSSIIIRSSLSSILFSLILSIQINNKWRQWNLDTNQTLIEISSFDILLQSVILHVSLSWDQTQNRVENVSLISFC